MGNNPEIASVRESVWNTSNVRVLCMMRETWQGLLVLSEVLESVPRRLMLEAVCFCHFLIPYTNVSEAVCLIPNKLVMGCWLSQSDSLSYNLSFHQLLVRMWHSPGKVKCSAGGRLVTCLMMALSQGANEIDRVPITAISSYSFFVAHLFVLYVAKSVSLKIVTLTQKHTHAYSWHNPRLMVTSHSASQDWEAHMRMYVWVCTLARTVTPS